MNDQSATEPRILKIANCPSLSGRTTLTYHVGCYDERNVCFRIWKTSGKGVFSNEWTSAFDIRSVLDEHTSLAAPVLLPIFKKGRSVNTAGFLMAVLKHEGLVTPSPDVAHQYFPVPSDAFVDEMSALIMAGASLDAEADAPAAERQGRRKSRGKANISARPAEAHVQ